MATLTELIRQEDPKRPYTDEQLAQMLQLRREQVVELRRINGISNSWMRLRPALVVEMQKLLEQEPGLSDRSLTLRLNAMGYNVSRYLVKELHSNLPEKEAEPQPEPAVEITTQEETEGTNVFAGMIGYDGGLKAQIHQAKAAVSYPPNGLHTLIIGPSGSGKTFLAENMYHYAVQQGLLAPDAPFVSFNCADYADNPQLLNSQLFGYVRGAFSGANATKDGLVQKADGGILFLDEIHRLSGEGQEMLFYLLDKGSYRRLGDSGPARKVNVRLIAATTSSPESALLLTFRRRIPIVISMPGIADRPMAERFAVLQSIFAGEYKKIDRKLVVEREAVRILLQYDCPGNIGQMQSDIQVCCANAFLESVSKQQDTVYIRAELVQQLISAGSLTRSLEVESCYDRQLVFPQVEDDASQTLDKMYYRLKEIAEEDCTPEARMKALQTVLLGRVLPQNNLHNNNTAKSLEQERQEVRKVVLAVLAEMRDSLNSCRKDFEDALVLSLTTDVPQNANGAQISLAEKYPAEMELAQQFIDRFRAKRPCNISDYKRQMLTLCLVAFSACKMERRIRIILMAHGQVGPAMAEVVNHKQNIPLLNSLAGGVVCNRVTPSGRSGIAAWLARVGQVHYPSRLQCCCGAGGGRWGLAACCTRLSGLAGGCRSSGSRCKADAPGSIPAILAASGPCGLPAPGRWR